jgi:hypothetical protein
MRFGTYGLVTIALAMGAAAAACGGSDGVPLGGPYGGTGSSPPPSAGQSTDGTDPADTPGDPGTSTSSSSTSSTSSSSSSGGKTSSSGGSSGGSSSGGSSSGGTSSSGGSSGTAAAPTWTKIYTTYLASSTAGRCSDCHGSCSTASGCYNWLKGKSQIPDIADPNYSCLSWLGGNMPPRGPKSNAASASDLAAWSAAGGQNN